MDEVAVPLPEEANPLKTVGQTVWIEGGALIIKYAVLYYGFLGTKRVPAENIKTISWREPGTFMAGFMEISILGERTPNGFASPNVQNQNRFVYSSSDRARWLALKDWIESAIAGHRTDPAPSVADELRKLAALRDDGILSAAEFEAQKAKLLG